VSDQSDRILVSLRREEAQAIWDGLTAFFYDSGDALSASLAAPDGIPEGTYLAAAVGCDDAGYAPSGAEYALVAARDFVPNHQPTP
jgi:hypothetical protein